jgi:hypothetical protein
VPDPIEIPQVPEGSQGLEPQVEQVVEPQPQEDSISVRYRGEERALPAAGVDTLAQALGTTREGAVNWIQRNMDANRAWNEAEKHRQHAEELDSRWQDHLATQGGQYQRQFTQPQPTPPPQYQQPTYTPPPQAEEDPIQMLRAIRSENQRILQANEAMTKAWEAERDRMKAEYETRQTHEELARVNSAADDYIKQHNDGGKIRISKDDLLSEVQISGLHMSRLPWERIFDKAWRVLTYDDAGQTAQQNLMQRLRAPDAKVIIPGAPASQPAPVEKRSDAERLLAGMSTRDAIELMPEVRR